MTTKIEREPVSISVEDLKFIQSKVADLIYYMEKSNWHWSMELNQMHVNLMQFQQWTVIKYQTENRAEPELKADLKEVKIHESSTTKKTEISH